MAIKSRTGGSRREGQPDGYDEETNRIVAALTDTTEPLPASQPAPASDATQTGATPATRPSTDTEAPVLPLPRAPRRSRGAIVERIIRFVMALLMASLLWIYVLDLENPAAGWTSNAIPIEVLGLAPTLSPRTDIGTVTITAQAPQDVTQRLTSSSFEPRIDLTGLGPGVHTVPVAVERPQGVLALNVEPSQVTVQLIVQGSRKLPVQLRLQGEPPLSYRVKQETQEVSPREVTVRGPQDAVDRVSEIVAEVNIDERRGTVEGEVRPRAIDFSGREVTGLECDPISVKVRVEIEILLGYKSLPIQVPIEGIPAPGYAVTRIDVNPTRFSLYGLPTVLEPLNFLETPPVNIEGVTESLDIGVTVPLTDGITLYPPGTSNEVNVHIEIEQLTSEATLAVLAQVVGLGDGLSAQVSPDRINITVRGPLEALQGLRPDSATATINLAGFGTGTFALAPSIGLPPNTTLVRAQPAEVTVTVAALPTVTPTITPSPTATPQPTATPTVEAPVVGGSATPEEPAADESPAPTEEPLPPNGGGQ